MSEKKIVCVIDGGGRGAALVHKYSQSRNIKRIISIPGNDLMQLNSKVPVLTFPKIKTTDTQKIVQICKRYKVDLVDIAQDNAVEAGVSDLLLKNGFNVEGPTRMAGQIEWDKAWARDFMKRNNLPIPKFKAFSNEKEAILFVKKYPQKRWFVKASGLAEGKGVIPAPKLKDAISAIKQMKKFGASGKSFVIEEWLDGEEFSMFAISDGNTFQIVGCAQDHKRLYDADTGPNTGGIGCSAPPLAVTPSIYKQAKKIIKMTLTGLRKEERAYKGVLYLGAIIVKGKVYVIEFNARWGDPEAQTILPSIKNDLFEIGMSIAKGNLHTVKVETDKLSRLTVTGLLRPGVENKKREIFGVDDVLMLKDIILYGTRISKISNKYYVTSGRLFHITAVGKNVLEARKRAYEAISQMFVEGNNLHYRTDIGWRDVQKLREEGH